MYLHGGTMINDMIALVDRVLNNHDTVTMAEELALTGCRMKSTHPLVVEIAPYMAPVRA